MNNFARYELLNGKEKHILHEHFDQLQFIDDCNVVDNVRCVNCLKIPFSHFYSNCKHLYCEKCKETIEKTGKCTKCHDDITDLTQQNVETLLKIYGLKTTCPNKSGGCTYEATLVEIPAHIQHCSYNGLAASYADTAQSDAYLQKLKDKLQAVELQTSSIRKYLRIVKDALVKDVNKFKPATPTQLEEDVIGTLQKITTHTNLPNTAICQLNQQIDSLGSDINEIDLSTNQQSNLQQEKHPASVGMAENEPKPEIPTCFELIVENVNDNNETEKNITGELFDITGHSVEGQIKLRISKNQGKESSNMECAIILRNKEGSITRFQDNPPLPKVTFTLLGNRSECDKEKVYEPPIRTQYEDGDEYFLTTFTYIDANTLTLKILVEFINFNDRQTNGVILWRLPIESIWSLTTAPSSLEQSNKCIYGPYMYSYKRGHRIQAKVIISNNKSKLRVEFLTGKYDKMLPETTLYLLKCAVFIPHAQSSTMFGQKVAMESALDNQTPSNKFYEFDLLHSNIVGFQAVSCKALCIKIELEHIGTQF
ncbi:hypothetical protein CHUAL_003671 [Chamberlinius hualienensis]